MPSRIPCGSRRRLCPSGYSEHAQERDCDARVACPPPRASPCGVHCEDRMQTLGPWGDTSVRTDETIEIIWRDASRMVRALL
jgi:hypothetical protein